MGNLIKTIANIGLHEGLSRTEAKKRRFFNIVTAIGCLAAIPQLIIALQNDIYAAGFIFVWFLTCILALFLHYRGKYKTARFIGLFIVYVFGSLAAARNGRELYPHIASFGLLVAIGILYDFRKEWGYILFFFILSGLLYYIVELNYLKASHPLPENIKLIRTFTLWGTIGFILAEIFFLVDINNKSELKVAKALKRSNLLREEIESLYGELRDSIKYGERIQQALLSSEEHENKDIPPNFVFFKPKDIVSGDFYWVLQKEEHFYYAVVDCTGHGVPGAFLTMLGTSFLNEINAHDHLLSPAQILDKLREKIIEELSQSGKEGDSKDGMDISLMKLNLETHELTWAGANNPLWVVTSNKALINHESVRKDKSSIPDSDGKSLVEVSADKQPIGFSYHMKPFTNHELQLGEGDSVYLFSDGFPDQFGGPKGKKFKYKPFKRLLLSMADAPPHEQRNKLATTFEDWKGNLEQVDDVCIVGIKL